MEIMIVKRLLLIISTVVAFNAHSTALYDGLTIEGYLDDDGIADTVTCHTVGDSNEYNCVIASSQNTDDKAFKLESCSSTGVSYTSKGHITLECGYWGVEEQYIFKYMSGDWLLEQITHDVLPMNGPDDPGWTQNFTTFKSKVSIRSGFAEMKKSIDAYQAPLSEMSENLKYNFILDDYKDKALYDSLFNKHPISRKNVTTYNNIAYYLEKRNLLKESSYLLKHIIKAFPKRIVSYINAADVYWKLSLKKEAKEAYGKYYNLMLSKGRKNKIPDRVLSRMAL